MNSARAPSPRWRLITLLAVLLSPLPGGAAPSVEATTAQLTTLKRELAEVERWLAESASNQAALDHALKQADQALSKQARATRAASQALAETQRAVRDLESELATTETAYEAQQAALATTVRSAWLLSRRSPLQLALEGESPDARGRVLTFQAFLAEHYGTAAAELDATALALKGQRATLEAERQVRVARQREATAFERQLAAARSQRARSLDLFRTRLTEKKAQRTALSQDASALAALLKRLEAEAAKRPFTARPGTFPWPLEGRVLQAFGAPLETGQLRANGLRLGAEEGTPARAIASGQVVFADWLRGFGLMIIIDHGEGWLSLYGQAESLLYREGQQVEAGEIIATAGRSGGARSAGLWFELRQDGAPQDPIRWCVARR
ncbi:MAG: murein hydrolase activator EnvC family protein [Pseudomonadales bacterium]